MTAPAEIRYARASGDVELAYTAFGDGPFDLVVAAGFVTHLDLQWKFPWFEGLRDLAEACRVITFDKRGTGLSDRSLGFGSLEERSDDIRAVMDAAGSERAVLYGVSEGGPMALLFAAPTRSGPKPSRSTAPGPVLRGSRLPDRTVTGHG